MPEVKDILASPKSMIIAPAGYGKTHFITSCISHAESKHLILTHTHAGVASLRQKLRDANIEPKTYNVETITSFAQKYVFAYSDLTLLPLQENSKEYYPYVIKNATEIFTTSHIKAVLKATYSMLFVDEYQDCSVDQHQLILALGDVLNICILGDPMQGIFDFSIKEPIDLQNEELFNEFLENRYELTTPWRWINSGSVQLGDDLHQIRQEISKGDSIDLRSFNSIKLTVSSDPYRYNYSEIMGILSRHDNLLVIIPDSKLINKRLIFQKRFKNRTVFLEAIDGKEFYILAKKCDQIIDSGSFGMILELLNKVFKKTAISTWFNSSGVKRKQNQKDRDAIQPINESLTSFISMRQPSELANFLRLAADLPGVLCYRKDLLFSIMDSLVTSESNERSVYQEMMEKRNVIRRIGRDVSKKCIGTTLLTKGLEFEAVLIVNCHEFTCKRNFYVAVSRATKNLYIFTSNPKIELH